MAKTDTKSAAPTSAAEWRRTRIEGELIRLPGSGNVARLRRPSLTAMAATTNGVPNPLSHEVMRLLASAPAATEAERIENVKRNSRGMVEVAALCLVEPRLRLVGDPLEGEIAPEDLSDYDLSFLYYTWVEGAASDVAPFRVVAERLAGD
jgi:hypothetical protein